MSTSEDEFYDPVEYQSSLTSAENYDTGPLVTSENTTGGGSEGENDQQLVDTVSDTVQQPSDPERDTQLLGYQCDGAVDDDDVDSDGQNESEVRKATGSVDNNDELVTKESSDNGAVHEDSHEVQVEYHEAELNVGNCDSGSEIVKETVTEIVTESQNDHVDISGDREGCLIELSVDNQTEASGNTPSDHEEPVLEDKSDDEAFLVVELSETTESTSEVKTETLLDFSTDTKTEDTQNSEKDTGIANSAGHIFEPQSEEFAETVATIQSETTEIGTADTQSETLVDISSESVEKSTHDTSVSHPQDSTGDSTVVDSLLNGYHNHTKSETESDTTNKVDIGHSVDPRNYSNTNVTDYGTLVDPNDSQQDEKIEALVIHLNTSSPSQEVVSLEHEYQSSYEEPLHENQRKNDNNFEVSSRGFQSDSFNSRPIETNAISDKRLAERTHSENKDNTDNNSAITNTNVVTVDEQKTTDISSTESTTCKPTVNDSKVCHNHEYTITQGVDNQKHDIRHDKTTIDMTSSETQSKGLLGKEAQCTGNLPDKSDTKIDTRNNDKSEHRDYNDNVESPKSLESFLPDFKTKMDKLGVKSQSLDTLVAKSTVTVGPVVAEHSAVAKLRRADTLPARHDVPDGQDSGRSIKVVQRTLSLDKTSNHVSSETKPASESSAASKVTKTILDELKRSEASGKPKATSSDKSKSISGMMENIDSATVLNLLNNIGERLEDEQKRRSKAEDWSEFLTSELDAHITARTNAELKYTALRDKAIQYKKKSKEKYKKLLAEHKALVQQLQELSKEDSPPKKDIDDLNNFRPLLRRNRSQTDRQAMLAKRNALMIRNSGKPQGPSFEEESSDSDDEKAPRKNGLSSHDKSSENLPASIDDLQKMWKRGIHSKISPEKQDTTAQRTSPARQSTPPKEPLSRSSSQKLSPPKETVQARRSLPRQSSIPNESSNTDIIKPVSSSIVQSGLKAKQPSKSSAQSPKSQPETSHIPVPKKSLNANDNSEGEKDGDTVVNVKAFTSLWEKKIGQTQAHKQQHYSVSSSSSIDGSSSKESSPVVTRNARVTPSSSFSRQRSSEVFVSPRSSKSDSVLNDDDDELEYLSAQEDLSLNESFSKTEGVQDESIDTRQVRSMFQNIANSSMRRSNSGAKSGSGSPPSKLKYSGSMRETRSRNSNPLPSEERTRRRAKTLSDGSNPESESPRVLEDRRLSVESGESKRLKKERSDSLNAEQPVSNANGAEASKDEVDNVVSERSTRFSSLMSRWQKRK